MIHALVAAGLLAALFAAGCVATYFTLPRCPACRSRRAEVVTRVHGEVRYKCRRCGLNWHTKS